MTSTPENSMADLHDSDISIIPAQPPCPVTVSDSSTADLDLILETCISHQQICSHDCDVHEQPTMRLDISDESLASQYESSQRNNNNMDSFSEQLAKTTIESLANLDQSANKPETSQRKRNKSVTSEQRRRSQSKYQSAERNKKHVDEVLDHIARDKIRHNLESLEDCDRSGNKLDTSKQSADKSETSETKSNKSKTSENKPVLRENKTSGDTLNKSVTSHVESWLETPSIDVSSKITSTTGLCWKNSVEIQIPYRADKSGSCDLSREEIFTQKSQTCDCSTKDSIGVQKQETLHESANVEEQSIDDDAKLKPCSCIKLECLKKDETEVQTNEEKQDVETPDKMDCGGGSSCDGACEQYYRNKLMATLKILENKEETIRVQGSSLGVAEARISALTERACALRCELDQKARELNKLRKFAESCRAEKADMSVTAEMQEVESQKDIVNTLQDNLSVIAELYRECFFETAKQEELIEMLRKSYLDVRLMDKHKSDKINRLQSVINTQKWSIEQCQDVVVEVENLKSEISNFLNSSNNDSGMWERGSESPDVGEELGDILDQLRQLQEMLTGDCTCGLGDENELLKKKNEHLEVQLDKLRQRVKELEGFVSSSHSLGQQYQKQIEDKEREFHEIRQRLADFESADREQGTTCETLTRQLQQSQVLLDDKIAELAQAQRARAAQDAAVLALRQELEQADAVIKEGLRKLVEASEWRAHLEDNQARVEELEHQLQKVCAQCRDLELCCREKDRSASVLQGQLEEAHARGAALCDESRRVTACVRHWMRRQRALAREQQEKIKTQESMLCELQRCVEARQDHSVRTSANETPCCSKSSPRLHACASEATYSLCSRTHQAVGGSETAFSCCGAPSRSPGCESERPSCSQCASNRQDRRERSSESEMASCSSTPVPPRRRKKLPPCGDFNCPWSPNAHNIRFASLPRQQSPTEEIVERVEQLHAALAATQRRWARAPR